MYQRKEVSKEMAGLQSTSGARLLYPTYAEVDCRKREREWRGGVHGRRGVRE